MPSRPSTPSSRRNIRTPTNCPMRSMRVSARSRRRVRLRSRPVVFDPAEIARAGAFVSIDGEGGLLGRARLCAAGGRGARRRRARGRQRRRRADSRRSQRPMASVQRAVITVGGAAGNRRGRGRRRHQAVARSPCHGADRASHAGAARCRGERSAGRDDGAAAQALCWRPSTQRIVERLPRGLRPARSSSRSGARL